MSPFSIKNNSKYSRKSHHLSLLKNNSETLRSMTHHISLLKNNSKKSKKSPHPTSHFSIEK
jgi:hypothetical protein